MSIDWEDPENLTDEEGYEKYDPGEWEWMKAVVAGDKPHDHIFDACRICGYMP